MYALSIGTKINYLGWPWTNKQPVFASLYLPKWRFSTSLRRNMSQTISNIRPRILSTINRKSTGSIDELRIICQGLYTCTAVARDPSFSWAFLFCFISVYQVSAPTDDRWSRLVAIEIRAFTDLCAMFDQSAINNADNILLISRNNSAAPSDRWYTLFGGRLTAGRALGRPSYTTTNTSRFQIFPSTFSIRYSVIADSWQIVQVII